MTDPTPQIAAPTTLSRTATAAEIEAELDRLTREVELALTLAGEGKMLDLTGLDGPVAAACQAAQALPADEARTLVERLGNLVGLLDRLAAELTHRFGNLPKDVETSPRVAADAYGKSSQG